MFRFNSSKVSPSAAASFNRRFASARDLSMSGQNPATFSNSCLVAARVEPGKTMPAILTHDRNLGECRGVVPIVDRKGQRAADPHIVERLLLVVWGHEEGAVPVALLHRDLVAEVLDQLIARRGRQAAELDCRAIAADRVDPD